MRFPDHDSFFLRRPSLVFLALLIFAGSALCQTQPSGPADLVLAGARVYPSPTARPINDAVIVVHDGKIVQIGTPDKVKVPRGGRVIDCKGKTITAGFWNSHVHFTEDVWNNAANAPSGKLEQHMQEMLTRWGFTTVFDIGSNPYDTLALRKRVDAGEVPGPRIFTTAGNILPENGIPVYVPPAVASQLKQFEAATPTDASRIAKAQLAMGADGLKLFTGSIMGHGKIVPMPANVAQAAVQAAHAAGKPVFAHPSNHIGTDNALSAGVDVLAHTIPIDKTFTPEELARMKAQHTGLIPTLTLWEVELEKDSAPAEDEQRFVQAGVNELKSYFDLGGTILFGTDVGYTQHYDTVEEHVLMAKSGMTWHDILVSLTTSPATFFKAGHTGELLVGNDADLVVLSSDPADDVRNFARVEDTIRAGNVIYGKGSN